MRALYRSVLVFTLLTLDSQRHRRVVVRSASTSDLQPDSITYILKSYADAFTTTSPTKSETTKSEPTKLQLFPTLAAFTVSPTTPSVSTEITESSNNVYSYPPAKPIIATTTTTTSGYFTPVPPSKELTPAGSKNVQSNLAYDEDEELGEHQEPPDHVIPYSEHEDPPEPATRPNYTAPGAWAKPSADKNISLDFVPTKLYAQVRGTHTVQHVPRDEAIKSAETDEEKANAARLKEVVKISKANTVYSEEGYEDAAYDHAGQIRDADFHEGFARKLNDHIDLNGTDDSPHRKRPPHGKRPRYGKRPRRPRNRRPRKSKSRSFDDYRDHAEEEARTHQKQVDPDDLKVLKSALNQSNLDPKNFALEGIRELERDLKKESEEIQRTSTEPYSSTTSLVPPIQPRSISRTDNYDYTTLPVEVDSISKSDRAETTTPKRDVFTVRPKKLTTPWPSIYVRKIKKPVNYYGTSSKNQNQNYNSIPSNSYDDKPPTTTTTESYENLLRQYVLNNPNLTPTVTYRPVSSASSNPLALATVNGHGPYLVVVTNSPNAMPSSSYEPLLSQPTSQYFTISHENRSNLASLSSQSDTGYERKNLRGKEASIRSGDADSFDDDEDAEEKEKPKDADELEFANFDPLPDDENEEKSGKPSLDKDMDQFAFMQPPKALDPFFADYPRQRDPGQWSVTRSKEELVESAYAVVEDDADAPKSLRPQKRVILPVTRLLPPSPLSTSEYTSFQMRDRRSEILPPTVMAIIEAIHKSEAQKTSSFPFLFRRKRSALGPTREWEIEQRDKKLQAAGKAKEAGFSRRNGKEGSGRPADFKYLLNESPKIALGVVDEEIAERFKEGSKEGSSEASTSSSDSDESHANFKAANKKPNGKGGTTVEVSLPELDFSNNYDEEEEEEVDPAALSEAQTVDRQKYPYYQNSAVLSTALEYVINPSLIPRKTVGGMEFYDSRRLECDEIEPNLEKIVPEEEELKNKRGARKGKLRLQGLGDKLDCFKAKFFDQNPLDNPLFIEKEVKLPPLPDELDPKKFASRISKFPPEKDDYVVQKGPKNPENYDSRSRKQKVLRSGAKQYYNTRPNYDASPTYVPPPSRDGPKNQKNRRPAGFSNSGRYIPEDSAETKPQPKPKIKKKRKKLNKNILPFESSDQAEVYEDVMGNIMRLEKIRRHPSSKYGFTPAPRLRHRDKGSHAGNNKNRQQSEIDGMIPPPPKQHISNNKNQYKNKYRYPNERERYYDSNESTYPVVSSRVYKRSIDQSKNDEQQLPEENTGNKTNETATHKIKYSTPNSISFTIDHRVPPSKINALAVGSVPTLESIQKHTNRSTQDTGRYDKFNDNKDETTSIDSRRNEPRYNVPNKKHISNPSNETLNTTNGNKTVIESSEDLSDFGSTFVPVIVKPDESTINKLLKENKEQIENAENKTKETEVYSGDKDEDVKKIDRLKNSKKRYSDDPVANAYALDPNIKEHKELNDFLEGEPPGYDKAFGPEAKYEVSSPPKQESLHKEESKVRRSYRQKDHSGEEESSKEDLSKSAEESSKETNSAEASSAENEESKEVAQTNQNDKKNSSESKDEPFERYSERPYSPPENYEDDKYSDLGPRINKPYFYHPPFEIPDYERDKYNKNKDPSDLHTSEESEDHETYVYPWEKDDNQNNDSKDHDSAGNYEYPWEKREKNKKDGSQEKYDATEENSEEATNTQPIYIPLNGKHVRGKKDVNKEEANPGNGTLPKYTSKYKIKPKYGFSKDGPTTESYLKDSLVSRPTVKTRTTHRSITNDTYIISSDADSIGNDSNSSNKTENSNETSTLKPASSSTISTTLLDPRYMQRRNKDIISRRSFSHATHVESTTPMLTRRRRGRVRNSTDSTPASTISSPYQNGRRRGRPAGIVASGSSLVATTTNDRRRRPFRVQNDSTPTSTVRTIAHHSRVSKQEIITKTTYPDEDDEEDSITEENSPRRSRSRKTTLTSGSSSSSPIELAKIRRGGRRPKNDLEQGELGTEPGDNDRPSKKKKVEKVVITMEETPDHVYETKEVDRDGVKGKFVTITANNNSDSSKNHHANGEDDDLHMQDAEIEEMNRRRSADNSFHSLMRDTEDLLDKSSGVEDYMVGDMLQKSPLPVTRKDSKTPKNGTEEYEGENDDDEHDEEEEDDDEVDDYEDHNDDDDEENEEEDNEDEAEDDNATDKTDKTDKKTDKDKDAEKKELEDQRTSRGNSTTRKAKPDDKDKDGIKNYPLKKKLEDKPVSRGSIRMVSTKPTDKPTLIDEIKKNDGKTTPRRRDIIISINDDSNGRENKTSNLRRRKPTVEESTKTPIKRSTAHYDEDEIKNTTSTETTIPAGVVKDPSIRKYFYVETD